MRRLEEQTQKYWLLSSYWNGRIDKEGKAPSVGTFIKRLQEFMSSGASFRLVLAIGKLLDEVIEHGRKPKATLESTCEVVQLYYGPGMPDALVMDADGQLWAYDYKTVATK